MEDITIDEQAEEIIARVSDHLKTTTKKEANKRGLLAEYQALYKKLSDRLKVAALEGDSILLSYCSFTDAEISFFKPRDAYLAGCKAKLNGDCDVELAYAEYLRTIEENPAYREAQAQLNGNFDRIIDALGTDYLKDDMYRLDLLWNLFTGYNKRKLHVFFYLGYECYLVDAIEMGLKKESLI